MQPKKALTRTAAAKVSEAADQPEAEAGQGEGKVQANAKAKAKAKSKPQAASEMAAPEEVVAGDKEAPPAVNRQLGCATCRNSPGGCTVCRKPTYKPRGPNKRKQD